MSALKKMPEVETSVAAVAASAAKSQVSPIKNRRAYFRMDIKAGFGFKILSDEEAQAQPLPRGQDVYEIMDYFGTDLCKMNDEFLQLLTKVKTKSTPLASMFEILNNKLNMILSAMDQKDIALVLPSRKINLSGNGIGFHTARSAEVGNTVDIMIKLDREDQLILIRAKVVRIITSEPHYLGLVFEDVQEQDRRRIISFLFDKQMQKNI